MALTTDQVSAVEQLRELTNASDDEIAISVLQTVDWDVQRATELIFGTTSDTSHRPAPRQKMEVFEFDDSEEFRPDPPRALARGGPSTVWSFLTLPLHFLTSILRFLFGALRIPLPRPFSFNLALFRPRANRHTQREGASERWIRGLEEETGAVSYSTATAVSGVEAGPSSSTGTLHNRTSGVEGRRVLPDFALCTYEEALESCKRDLRIGSTLTDPALVQLMHEHNLLVWGGDVRDTDPYAASLRLHATTYPFVAFVALQPRRGVRPSSSSSASESLTVLSRHQGPSVPAASGPTAAQTLIDYLNHTLLPRVEPFLARVRTQRDDEALEAFRKEDEAARNRRLRDEQDRAFAATAAKDVARIEALMKAEQEEKERKRREEVEAEERAIKEAMDLEKREQKKQARDMWRAWTRYALEESDRQNNADVHGDRGQSTIRLAIRLPDGSRVVRSFDHQRSLTYLYAFIDSKLGTDVAYVSSKSPQGHEWSELERAVESQIELAGSYFPFILTLAYPRIDIPWSKQQTIHDVDCLRSGGQVVVRFLDDNVSYASQAADDDGYESEE
ncbi:unnamed protein product [Mycena citricolor]|uniref:UBX domain-containing protein n=1 Tax=Mycena citricolor TaxID=2018698 RepID=A0AAD2JU85_9AGAR|nr:unnamed protein product [Mycena citricolor]